MILKTCSWYIFHQHPTPEVITIDLVLNLVLNLNVAYQNTLPDHFWIKLTMRTFSWPDWSGGPLNRFQGVIRNRSQASNGWGLCENVVVHTIWGGSPVIL